MLGMEFTPLVKSELFSFLRKYFDEKLFREQIIQTTISTPLKQADLVTNSPKLMHGVIWYSVSIIFNHIYNFEFWVILDWLISVRHSKDLHGSIWESVLPLRRQERGCPLQMIKVPYSQDKWRAYQIPFGQCVTCNHLAELLQNRLMWKDL